MDRLALINSVQNAATHLAFFGLFHINELLDVDPITLPLNVFVECTEVVGIDSLWTLGTNILAVNLRMP
ncbi:hypothetical protein D3C85_1245160 [compost metagenome]